METAYFCRRCNRDLLDFPGRESHGVLNAKSDDHDPRYRTRAVETPFDSARHSGPYCRSCAYDRQTELKQQDRRQAKRNTAQQEKRNVHDDDCCLIAAMTVSKKSYRFVMREAKALGYRPNKGGLRSDLMLELLRRCGLQVQLTAAGRTDGGEGTRGTTCRAIIEAAATEEQIRGKYVAVAVIGNAAHAMAIDTEDVQPYQRRVAGLNRPTRGRVYNANARWMDAECVIVAKVS